MNWGKWIVVAFVLFAAFIATLVTVCVTQDIPLVSNQYYQEELQYQDKLDQMNNANALDERPEISVADNTITVAYSRLAEVDKGELKLMRPSDARLDQLFKLTPTADANQSFSLGNAKKGMYRARLQWEQEGISYFIEKVIVL